MSPLNYQHLRYFWVVAKEGGLVPAGRALRLSHPTLSAQIHALEGSLGEKLFVRVGRRLTLTDVGQVAFRYAEEIFGLGRELVDTIQGRGVGKTLRFEVGVVDAVPKLVVRKLLQPALSLSEPVHVVCHEGPFDRLLQLLSQHALDLVIADSPVPPGSAVRAHGHLLGTCGVDWFAAKPLAQAYRHGFPRSLDGAPFLLPREGLTLRRSLNQWFDRNRVRPSIVAEFDDSALLEVFGADGVGVFPVPAAVDRDVETHYRVARLGEASGVEERFHAISMDRRLSNPAVLAILRSAESELRSDDAARR